jgi:DNA-binding transcriptional ArsR family regulator
VSNHLDYELDREIVADTPTRLKALSDPLRSLLLDLVLERAMSVTELAARVGRPKGSVAHHVDVLVDAGLLRVVRTRQVRAVTERFYGRTARTIRYPGAAFEGDLPFVAAAREMADLERMASPDHPGTFTLRAVRIPDAKAAEFAERLDALALEYSEQERGGEHEYALLIGLFVTNRSVVAHG